MPSDSGPSSEYYNIDLNTGKILSNREALEKYGLSEESLDTKIMDTLRDEYDNMNAGYESFDEYYENVTFYYSDIDDTNIYFENFEGKDSLMIENIETPNTLDASVLWINL